ncbi:MAG: glycosyltransferase family 2 protein [Leptolyngbyaceae cyanobacterium bins.59]|nr:glycosyltransferase family 2 protein [Leptolyngbyaceae cyanobacterium bins.59]
MFRKVEVTLARPTLSVLLPNYNHAAYISEALQAILEQTYQPLEVIVIDDASTDASLGVIEPFVRQFPHVRLLKNAQNQGAVASANRALEVATGDYIYWAAADDRVLPGFFEQSMTLLAQYPEAGLCFADLVFLDAKTGVIHPKHLGFQDQAGYLSPPDLVTVMRRTREYIPGYTAIFKRSALLDVGRFIPELQWHSDWFALHAIGFRYGACYIPEPLAAFRFLPNSFSSSSDRWHQQRPVLDKLLHLLAAPSYRDVAPYFQESRILSKFGSQLVRLVWSEPLHRPFLSRSLLGEIGRREVKNLLIRVGPLRLRQLFWTLRLRYQTLNR